MVKLRKLMFVLPNLFTVTSIFCGFYALTLCSGEATPAQLYQAAIAIFFAMFFDGFDGRVARLTRTQSQFGVELDSLADVVSFGVVPAMLAYKWALAPLGLVGIFIAFGYAACGALRLARFNVIAQRSPHGGASAFFVGLPIPFAALGIVSMVLAHYALSHGSQLPATVQVPIAVVVVLLSLLMVSTIPFRTFKHVRPSSVSIGIFVVLCALSVAVSILWHPAFVLVLLFGAYLLMGFGESMLALGRRLSAARVGLPAAAVALEDDDVDEDEDDIDEQDYL
ncbi:MAG: CDP-diacylglycerol--serine O-phosphatidyltransferase [Myxococcaceae bacterium]|nr:CDP-diacylglycerol--serine O-phosphatidyltransferase [Myxococcaceae bacterium]